MANPRKQIILNEILFWKKNKLLPEHYCDFLITLYSEGNEVEIAEEANFKKAVKAKEQRFQMAMSVLLIFISVVFLAILFLLTDFAWLLVPVVGIIALIFMIAAFNFAKKNHLFAPVLQTAAALLIFGLSVKVSLTYFGENQFILYSLLIANCFMWTVTGLKLKLHYFSIAGILGVIILIGYQLFFL